MKRIVASFLLVISLIAYPAIAQQPAAGTPTRRVVHEVTAEEATGEAAEVIALDKKIGESIVSGDINFFNAHTSDDFSMTHGAQWTKGDKPTLVDTKQSFGQRVASKAYKAYDLSPIKIEMHQDLAIIYGRYIANIPPTGNRAANMAWFSCWFEHVYEKQNGKWMYVSHRTVYGPTYGETRESIQDK